MPQPCRYCLDCVKLRYCAHVGLEPVEVSWCKSRRLYGDPRPLRDADISGLDDYEATEEREQD